MTVPHVWQAPQRTQLAAGIRPNCGVRKWGMKGEDTTTSPLCLFWFFFIVSKFREPSWPKLFYLDFCVKSKQTVWPWHAKSLPQTSSFLGISVYTVVSEWLKWLNECQNLPGNSISYFWAKCLEVARDQYLRSEQQRSGHYYSCSCNVQSTICQSRLQQHWFGCILVHRYLVQCSPTQIAITS